jgi:glucuronate isomerase
VDANFLARLVARHVIDIDDARVLAHVMAYELARDTYRLGTPPEATSFQARATIGAR